MIREICTDKDFLSQKADRADENDLSVGQDLIDTLTKNQNMCVGMAANMIGVNKSIIIFDDNGGYTVMYNPEIIKKSGEYTTEEGCLSLLGKRPAVRYKNIKVQWQNEKFQTRIKSYSGWTAQIIQHEIDHLHGIII